MFTSRTSGTSRGFWLERFAADTCNSSRRLREWYYRQGRLMDNSRSLSRNNSREHTVSNYITQDLGYCCEWLFFSLYSDTSLIAARLGVGVRAVRYHKKRQREGELHCRGCNNCMKERVLKS